MKSYLKLLRFVKPHKTLFIATFIVMIIYSFLNSFQIAILSPILKTIFYQKSAPPYKIKHLPWLNDFLNSILQKDPLEATKILALLLMGIFLVKAIFTYLSKFMCALLQEKITRDIRVKLFEKVMNMPLSYFTGGDSGDLISRFINDIQLVKVALTHGIYVAIREGLMTVFYLALCFISAFYLALVAFILIPLSLIFVVLINRTLKKRAKKAQEKMGEIGMHLFETLSGIKLIKGLGMEDEEKKRFRNKARSYYRSAVNFQLLGALSSPVNEFMTSFVAAALLYIGALFIFKYHSLTPDRFFVFLAAALSMMSPIKHLTQINTYLQEGLAAGDRLFQVFESQEEKWSGTKVFSGLKDGIELKKVNFSYKAGSQTLKNINLKLKKGRKTAIVGHTGSGKTTLLDLIAGFHYDYEGKILIDGTELREFDIKSYRSKIALVPQDVFLFKGTLRENITYGVKNYTEEEFKKAVKIALVDDFVKRLPEEYDTQVGERGSTLSGGEKQRIAIARAILRKSDIILLDEATSALDNESERRFKEMFKEIEKNALLVVIAHRLSTVLDADEIVVMDRGEIVAKGKHEELLKSSPHYRKLYESQFA